MFHHHVSRVLSGFPRLLLMVVAAILLAACTPQPRVSYQDGIYTYVYPESSVYGNSAVGYGPSYRYPWPTHGYWGSQYYYSSFFYPHWFWFPAPYAYRHHAWLDPWRFGYRHRHYGFYCPLHDSPGRHPVAAAEPSPVRIVTPVDYPVRVTSPVQYTLPGRSVLVETGRSPIRVSNAGAGKVSLSRPGITVRSTAPTIRVKAPSSSGLRPVSSSRATSSRASVRTSRISPSRSPSRPSRPVHDN